MSGASNGGKSRVTVDTFQTEKAAAEACWQLRRQYPRREFDIAAVWRTDPPIRTVDPWAVIEWRPSGGL